MCGLQIYGKENVFDVERLIDLLGAFETFREASQSARGDLDSSELAVPTTSRPQQASVELVCLCAVVI